MLYYVYIHTKPDGTVFYVGKGKNNRAWSKKGRNPYWLNVVNKHGFNAVVLANNLSEKDAIEEEALVIQHFKKFNTLTNILDRGDINPMSDSKTISKMIASKLGKQPSLETRIKMSVAHKKIRATEKTKQKMRENNLGSKNKNFKGQILAIDLATNIKTVFVGSEALKLAGFDNSKVYNCVNGKRKTHKGHTFKRISSHGG
jgi:hypothetical protein